MKEVRRGPIFDNINIPRFPRVQLHPVITGSIGRPDLGCSLPDLTWFAWYNSFSLSSERDSVHADPPGRGFAVFYEERWVVFETSISAFGPPYRAFAVQGSPNPPPSLIAKYSVITPA